MAEIDRPDRMQLRVSDADRHKVAEILREAAGDGRLDLDELDERLEAAYAAKTYADLVPITVDLPAHQAPPSPVVRRAASVPAPTTTYENSLAVMASVKRRGAWLVPESSTAFALMGDVSLDLREATLAARVVTINAHAIMGSVKVVVDAHTQVQVEGVPLMGDYQQARDRTPAQIDPDSPTVRVKGMALMGSVTVVRLPEPGTPKRLGRRH